MKFIMAVAAIAAVAAPAAAQTMSPRILDRPASIPRTVILQPQPALDPGFLVARQFSDAWGPVVELHNGAQYRLISEPPPPVKRAVKPPRRFDWPQGAPRIPQRPPADGLEKLGAYDPANPPTFVRAQALPASVTLAANQTPIRNQTGDSCTWFAVTAGIEAAYNRLYATTLDLSETHFNHVLKMQLAYDGEALPNRENQLGAWGGGNVHFNLDVMALTKLGVPPQAEHPNAPSGDYSSSNAGDMPDLMNWQKAGMTQREFDDFNLGDAPRAISIPAPLTWTSLPPRALLNARYRATSHVKATDPERVSLDWYRSQLALGREVVIQFVCCDALSSPEGRPPAGGAGGASHAALLVGYDDANQTFRMKNSWGENDFRPYHYDNVTRGFVQLAAVITDVLPPAANFPVEENPQAYLGRWLLTDAGQPGSMNADAAGILDIYLIPVAGRRYRLGTFFAQDGTAYRVNGALNGRVLEFNIDPQNPNPKFADPASGMRYQAIMFADKRTMMTGRASAGLTGGFTRGFVARKLQALPYAPFQRPAPPTPDTIMKTTWQVELDEEAGVFLFNRYVASENKYYGTFRPNGGAVGNAWAVVNGDRVTLWSDQNTLRIYNGWFANGSKTVIAGIIGSNVKSAFTAILTTDTGAIVIPAVPGTLGPAAPN